MYSWRVYIITLFSCLTLLMACSSEDQPSTDTTGVQDAVSDTEDMGVEDASTEDASTEDASTEDAEDASISDDLDTTADTTPDTTEEDHGTADITEDTSSSDVADMPADEETQDLAADTGGDDSVEEDTGAAPHVYDTVIVGAGASGLYAGYLLNQEEMDIVIIEASDTYGGRMRPLEGFADFPIELGAENLVGRGNTTGDNPSFIYEDIMANYPERLVRCWEDTASTDELYDLGSRTVFAWETGDPDIIELWNFYSAFGSYSGPDILLSDHLMDMLGMSTYNRMYHLYDGYFGGEYGTSNTRLGMHSLTVDWNLYRVGGGSFCFQGEGISYLKTMTDLYFNEVLDRVIYNSPVTEIDYTDDIAIVHDANGESYYGETVLVTPSVAVLRDELITFNPVLPEEKVTAYNTIGMDPGIKLILKFTEPFWDTSKMYSLYSMGPTAMCWTPGLTRPDGTNNILICFIMGENAETMIALGEDGTIEQALSDLDAMFPPNQASNVFDEAYIQNWTDEPWIRGIYSYGAPGTHPLDGSLSMREILAQPVDGTIFFSGEATAQNHPASVHGAVESGRRAANEILEVME